MTVEIERYDPASQRSYQEEYRVEDSAAVGMTIADLLAYITRSIDPTLGYYSHSVCNHGICGRCMLQVNGKPVLACTAKVSDFGFLHLSPVKGQALRDLVVAPKE